MTIDIAGIVVPIGIALLGLLFGSFVTMASYRIPRGQDIVIRRSHCVHCDHNLSVLDLFPLFSWLFHRGKCAYCAARISVRYPLIELSLCVLFLLIYSRYGLSPSLLILCLVSVCLMIMIVTDIEHYIIPNAINVALLPLALCYGWINHSPLLSQLLSGLAGLAIGLILRGVMQLWKKKEGLGLGDVKFLGIVGGFISPITFPAFFFLAGVLGVISGLVWRLLGNGKLFPFGPALALALFICLMIPDINQLFEGLVLWMTRML